MRKLAPYQYKLKLRGGGKEKVPPPFKDPKPHILMDDGIWKVFRNKWKSQFRGPKLYAACISAPTLPELRQKIRRAYDGYRFGANHICGTQ